MRKKARMVPTIVKPPYLHELGSAAGCSSGRQEETHVK